MLPYELPTRVWHSYRQGFTLNFIWKTVSMFTYAPIFADAGGHNFRVYPRSVLSYRNGLLIKRTT
ncbi:hypothetical protein PILCRDRAFT_825685 [Piloderma croceum F 1598]|uniref:Uncharacterized protein n=1 Tax=Piloderma croceum (strain F 1598) TaxID=765440 RepID=A0A0C3BIH3_PILCF|nr:hypothetical protein PILCRDRAFT_829140 [Piloderma croceum F 1598]KIM77137.1 hypothetical protein PILCRDRAFT_825685 [Piloderma croceum F 1598]